MSRVGKKPINIPAGVEVSIDGRTIKAKGNLGELSYVVPEQITWELKGNTLTFSRGSNLPSVRALHGLARALVQNMITGVSKGFAKRLEIRGTGYRASVSGNKLTLSVGLSHPVVVEFPKDVTIKVEGTTTREQLPTTIISVSGIDRSAVGHWADQVRRSRPPEPYKGKGIRYEGEYVRRKAGKTG
ncbi:50S ribosomal protein L6 [bacterium]|nr:50S ribosomal protein L6 [bacterium]